MFISSTTFSEGDTTLAVNNAVKAIVYVALRTSRSSVTDNYLVLYARKAGLSGVADIKWEQGRVRNNSASNTVLGCSVGQQLTVNIDASGDFELAWAYGSGSTITQPFEVVLVGYYV